MIFGHLASDRLGHTKLLCNNKAKKQVRAVGMSCKTNQLGITSHKDASVQRSLLTCHINPSCCTLCSVEDPKAAYLASFDTNGAMPGKYHTTVDLTLF